jgi:D-threonate/D-erythronate kinase
LAGRNTLVIIADDLTGANDSGVQFARLGWRTRVLLRGSGHSDSAPLESNAVTVINAGTRSLQMNEAYARTEELTKRLKSGCRVYKKLDSTMRGNIGAEIEAMMGAGSFSLAVIAPAYPAKGRTTIGGTHLLNGVPLEETELARDPIHPIRSSKLTELIRGQTDWPAAHLELSSVRGDSLAEEIKAERINGIRLFTFDAVNDSDLDRICAAVESIGSHDVLWAGSAGLAGALARRWSGADDAPPTGDAPAAVRSSGAVLVIAGSMSALTARQLRKLVEHGVDKLALDPSALLWHGEAYAETDSGRRLLAEAEKLLARRRLAVVLDDCEEARRESRKAAERAGLTSAEAGRRIAEALGAWGATLIAAAEPGGLILTGGDTAYAVCSRIGVEALEIVGEVEEGLPVCLAGASEYFASMLIVTKAGAFGSEQSLLLAVEKLEAGFKP